MLRKETRFEQSTKFGSRSNKEVLWHALISGAKQSTSLTHRTHFIHADNVTFNIFLGSNRSKDQTKTYVNLFTTQTDWDWQQLSNFGLGQNFHHPKLPSQAPLENILLYLLQFRGDKNMELLLRVHKMDGWWRCCPSRRLHGRIVKITA